MYKNFKNKYGNQKVKIDGFTFDSKKEARRYQELKLLEKAGNIKNLILQPKFILQSKFEYNGKTEREINYISDFYYEINREKIVEDVKGFITAIYKIKRKLFLKKYGNKYTFIES